MSDVRQISDNEMFCSHCGAVILKAAEICPKCGCRITTVQNQTVVRQTNPDDKVSVGFVILSILIPLLGLIFFIVWKKSSPSKAKSCGVAALISFIVVFVFTIISNGF